MLLDDVTEMFAHDAAPRAAEDISYKKNAQMKKPHGQNKNLLFTLEQVDTKSYLIYDGYRRILMWFGENLW